MGGRLLGGTLLAVGGFLLLLNLLGFVVPLRAPGIDGYRDFSGTTIPLAEANRRLLDLAEADIPRIDLFVRATRLFNEGLAHLSPEDHDSGGPDRFRLRVPPTENWVLFALSYAKPDTYLDYEFCSHRRALTRGVGRCGQTSLALVSFLSARGVETGFVSLGGRHTLVLARVDEERWYLLDPDYGGVIPFDAAMASRNPQAVLEHYWSPAAREQRIDALFAGAPPVVRYGGPRARFSRACPIETAAYALKWLVPATFLALGASRRLSRRRYGL